MDQAQCIGVRREHKIYRMAVINQSKTIVICGSCLAESGERKCVGLSLSLAREKKAGEGEMEIEEETREREGKREEWVVGRTVITLSLAEGYAIAVGMQPHELRSV